MHIISGFSPDGKVHGWAAEQINIERQNRKSKRVAW